MTQSVESLSRRIKGFEFRAKALSSVRRFFDAAAFVEVETPVGIIAPASEEFIEAPKADSFFLRTSPELQMKRLLAAGMKKIYQIGPCFRENENGRIHRPEFDMLEYYAAGIDYRELLDFTREMIRAVTLDMHGKTSFSFRGNIIDCGGEWEIISVRDAFRTFAGKSADECAETDGLFETVLVEKVEPSLPKDRPCVLIDYPIRFGAFARPLENDPTLAERWEIYIGGVELANAYGELVDPLIQRERFMTFSEARKNAGLEVYPEATAFLEAIDHGIPQSSGCALGFDRLVMVLFGADDISQVSYPLDS